MIIDTDAGGDDTQALIYAFSEAKKHNKTIIGITCIDGNTSRENVVKNCLIAMGVADVKIPIFKGFPFYIQGHRLILHAGNSKMHILDLMGLAWNKKSI